MAKILQLKIQLQGITPAIWRSILVDEFITFDKLHRIIQAAMGWENYHLYKFDIGGVEISVPDTDYEQDVKDSKRVRLAQLLGEKQKFFYTYDFGDNWEHIITVEKTQENDYSRKYPVCIAGARACPPEDCGGVHGYEKFLQAINNPKHKEHKQMLGWIGGEFDAERFDINGISRNLMRIK